MAPSDPPNRRTTSPRSLPTLPWTVAWILLGFGLLSVGWMVTYGYHLNLALLYYGGLLCGFLLVVLSKRLSLGVVFHNVANTLLLLVVGLCALDAIHGLRTRSTRAAPSAQRAFSFEVARGDPQQFRNWWKDYLKEWNRLFQEITMPDPSGQLPFRFRPGSQVQFRESLFSINSHGLRDREFPLEKQGQYRIVALGESTTMGVTLQENDRPWSVALEERIRQSPDGPRPVQVINAGVSGYTLADGLILLRGTVLPLKPDLLISYFGYNGFDFLIGPTSILRETAPVRNSRPSPTLEGFEYQWNLQRYRRRNFQPDPDPVMVARLTEGLLESHYAKLYGDLIAVAQENDIPLVLASFNMAVHHGSSPEVIEFYRAVFPSVNFSILANQVHNRLIRSLAEQHDGVWFVDISTGLDGSHEHYIDLVHFTQSGRERLAQNLHAELQDLLKSETQRHRLP
jgi:lysophospholipase L1-like esterase